MNKKYKLSALLVMCLVLTSCLFFVAACDNDGLDTNQLSSSEITLKTFGPCPIPRGAELRFIGTHLDQVQSVEIPGSTAITAVKVINANEIRVIVPQDAQEGIITLKTAKGEIKTVTEITYNEPIVVSSVTPLTAKPGTTIKVEGDYLNLIEEIIFADDVHVLKADFKSQSRTTIEVTVPLEAQTGKIIASDGADFVYEGDEPGVPVWVYSDEVLSVVLPSITKIEPVEVKPGVTEVTITGGDFDLVKAVVFSGDKEVTDFTRNGSEIKVIVPDDAQDGVVTLIAKSNQSVIGKTLLTMKMPVISNPPAIIKNNAELTLTGTDLDLISGVKFGDTEADVKTKTATGITFVVPKAVTSAVTLITKSGKTKEISVEYKKPSISNLSSSVTAGTKLTIIGSDLDLVSRVIFTGAAAPVIIGAVSDANSLEVSVPYDASTGVITLVAFNGSEVKSSQVLTVNEAMIPVVRNMPSAIKPGELLIIEGTRLNDVQYILFESNVKVTNFAKGDNLITVYVPQNAKKGSVKLKLVYGSGENDYAESPAIAIGGTDPVADPSLIIFDFENGLAADGRWNGVGQESEIDGVSGKYYEITTDNWSDGYWWFADNWRYGYPSVSGKANYVVKIDVRLRKDIPAQSAEVRLMFSDQAVNILPYLLQGDVWTTGGDWVTIAIPLSDWTGLADPTPDTGDQWGISTWVNGVNFTGFCMDNVRYEKK
ncbi:MAG: glycan-binding surface protein [Mediterranea sp.]|jgi:hypothetical protein|nr:glycan-binding surface protein [Mediterranea sp.]